MCKLSLLESFFKSIFAFFASKVDEPAHHDQPVYHYDFNFVDSEPHLYPLPEFDNSDSVRIEFVGPVLIQDGYA